MKRLLLAMALCGAMTAAADAAPVFDVRIDTPETFAELPGLADKIATTATQSRFFGEVDVEAVARAWGRSGQGALYVTKVAASEPAPSPEAALRGALDRVRSAPVSASPQAGSTTEVAYRETIDGDVVQARFEWQHLSNETITLTRALAWVSPEGAPRLLTAECVFATDQSEMREPCETALASLAASDADKASRPLGDLGDSSAPKQASVMPAVDDAPITSGPSLSPPPQQPGRVLYEGPAKDESKSSSSTWILLGGVLIAIAFFLTTQSRRGKGEGRSRDDEPDEGVEADGNDDADDAELADDASDDDGSDDALDSDNDDFVDGNDGSDPSKGGGA